MTKRVVCSTKYALKEIAKIRDYKVHYGVYVRPFLPTQNERGLEGCAIAKVTRKEFVKVVKDLLRNFESRGAKITLTVPEEEHESFLI